LPVANGVGKTLRVSRSVHLSLGEAAFLQTAAYHACLDDGAGLRCRCGGANPQRHLKIETSLRLYYDFRAGQGLGDGRHFAPISPQFMPCLAPPCPC
jgi:hypothetical protein